MFVNQIAKAISDASGCSFEIIKEKIEVPPDSKLGDFAFPCFILSKELKKAPPMIAQDLVSKLSLMTSLSAAGIFVKAIGPYLNFYIDHSKIVKSILFEVLTEKENYGKGNKTEIVLVESPGPNTNKPLHMGHLRNILLGDSIYKILLKNGKNAHLVNIVNDRGVHICKSMLAYQMFGKGITPESTGIKSDHFVGNFYVEYAKYAKEHPEVEEEIQKMLVKWEDGDSEVRKLWAMMNKWALDGFSQTYKLLDFNIEKEYFESDVYLSGKDIILDGLNKGLFEKDAEGGVILDLENKGLGKKVLLRSNGTAVYITQDIAMAKKRYDDYKFDEMIYVVGNEQEHHFKVLFEVFKTLGWSFGNKCAHFSYGMVELPEGKMKSREGNVVDTDNLVSDVILMAKEEITSRYSNLSDEEIQRRSKIIAMGAIRFFILKHDAKKGFVYNPKESLAFEGETGPYVQYTHARICSILRKTDFKFNGTSSINYDLLNTDLDKEVVKLLGEYPAIVDKSASELSPNVLCNYLTKLAQKFNNYYAGNKIIQEDVALQESRLCLIYAVKILLSDGLKLLGIDAPEEM
jgi:arginyl-tRNA synthetase